MLSSSRTQGLVAAAAVAVAIAAGAFAFTRGSGSAASASPGAASGGAGPGGVPGFGGPRGRGFGFDTDLTAAAAYLGLTRTKLETSLRSGKALAQVAAGQGKSEEGLVAALVAAETKGLTAAQKSQRLAQIESRVRRFVSSSGPPAPPTGRGRFAPPS